MEMMISASKPGRGDTLQDEQLERGDDPQGERGLFPLQAQREDSLWCICRSLRGYFRNLCTFLTVQLIAEDVLTSKIYAVKMEHAKSPPSKLEYESLVYKSLDGISTLRP